MWNIILYNFWMDFLPKFDILSFFVGFVLAKLFRLFDVTDVMVTFGLNHWMLLADVIAMWLYMADVISHCGGCESHLCLFVENHIVVLFGCGRCYGHSIDWLMSLP